MDYNEKFAELNAVRMYKDARNFLDSIIKHLVHNHWMTASNGEQEETRMNEIKATMDHISKKIEW